MNIKAKNQVTILKFSCWCKGGQNCLCKKNYVFGYKMIFFTSEADIEGYLAHHRFLILFLKW